MKNWLRYFHYFFLHNQFILFVGGYIIGIIIIDANLWMSFLTKIPFILLFVIGYIIVRYLLQSNLVRVFLLGLFFGLIWFIIFFQLNFSNIEDNYEKEIDTNAIVVKDSVVKDGKRRLVVRTDKYGKIQVYKDLYPYYLIGDRVRLKGRLIEPPEFETFSYKEFLKIEKINYLMYDPEVFDLLNNKVQSFSVNRFFAKIRNSLLNKINSYYPEPHASLLSGLILGTSASMPDWFDRSLQVTGTTHIIAVSGYNVSLVLLGIFSIAGFIPRKYVYGVAFLGLISFIFLVGLTNLPALRATVMGFIVLISLLVGRRSSIVRGLVVVVFLFVFFNPLIYKSVSFQLSIVATIGIIAFAMPIQSFLLGRVPKIILEDLSATFAAIIWTTPITISTFGSFSIIAPFVNILVLPIIPNITILGIVFLIFSFINQHVAYVLSFCIWVGLEYVVRVIDLFGGFEMFYIEELKMGWIGMLMVYLLLIFVLINISYLKLNHKLSIRHQKMLHKKYL